MVNSQCEVAWSSPAILIAWLSVNILSVDRTCTELMCGLGRMSQCRSLMLSILSDRQADRPMEWDIRNGVIQRYGRRHGIAVPISDVVVPLLAAGSEGPG
ncbi:ketopantoate reductase family oxidoreductase [Enterobacter hormaechei ATCC 49162]|nr:ketopantoate reductase family oxidoreductase [Enterobacter hormaechei ATCC 49162]